ncbi:MAG: phosphoserine phosphatase SerB [Parasphingorhabdus sp.]|nr:phosphoserine phosphatase SerB [Parasphingorhabdus sp.]
MGIATLIATEALAKGELSSALDHLNSAGATELRVKKLSEAASDIYFVGDVASAKAALIDLQDRIDVAVQSGVHRFKKLLVSDMDSTMITVECIDELADYAGIKPQISAITERAMLGELDFVAALRARVQLLAGLDVQLISKCLEERVRIMPGAEQLVRTMTALGAETLLVSGGFTRFADPVAVRIGFAHYAANILAEAEGKLSGELDGKIVDADRKVALLQQHTTQAGLSPAEVMAVGDGANDIPMIAAAGLGIAYHAKPKARAAADVAIDHADLTALLYVQGITPDRWAER